MIRRLFTAASLISLLLALATAMLWVRSRSRVDLWEVLTRGHSAWQFSSSPREWALVHVADWPESTDARHTSYSYADAHDLEGHSLPVLMFTSPGAFVRNTSILGVSFQRGRLSTLVGRDGAVIRIPPSPPGTLLQYASTPLPYWTIALPGWLLPTVLLLSPCGMLLWRAQTWVRRRRRSNRTLCERCGYDIRASAGRCPECGTPIL